MASPSPRCVTSKRLRLTQRAEASDRQLINDALNPIRLRGVAVHSLLRLLRKVMLRLTIDDQPIEVSQGYTVLQAAREHGIAIPTLCYLESLLPYAAWGSIG